MTDKRKIEVLKIIQEGKDNNWSIDFESLEKKSYDKGFLKAMITEGVVGWSGVDFYITEKGDKILRDYLIIESQDKEQAKIKVIFDSHIFDKIVDGDLDINLLEKNKEQYEFYITHIQIDEINRCPDEEKRAKLLLFKTKIRPIVIPTESIVLGTSRFGESKFGDGELLEKLRKDNPKHTKDALIGETAIRNNLLLVTNDDILCKRVNSNGGTAITLEEFMKKLK